MGGGRVRVKMVGATSHITAVDKGGGTKTYLTSMQELIRGWGVGWGAPWDSPLLEISTLYDNS